MKLSARIYGDIKYETVADRWYRITHPFVSVVDMGKYGTKRAEVQAGFMFDGRSGPKLVDWVAPNLGTQEEIKRWLNHDLWSYDLGLTFKENNQILRDDLEKFCGYGWIRRNGIYCAVSISDSYFGTPKPNEREFVNVDKIKIFHDPR